MTNREITLTLGTPFYDGYRHGQHADIVGFAMSLLKDYDRVSTVLTTGQDGIALTYEDGTTTLELDAIRRAVTHYGLYLPAPTDDTLQHWVSECVRKALQAKLDALTPYAGEYARDMVREGYYHAASIRDERHRYSAEEMLDTVSRALPTVG